MNADDLAFDDDGRPCLATPFSYPDEGATYAEALERSGREAQAEAVNRLLSRILEPGTVDGIARRALLIAYIFRLPGGPHSQRQLARLLRLSVGRVNRLCAEMRAMLHGFR